MSNIGFLKHQGIRYSLGYGDGITFHPSYDDGDWQYNHFCKRQQNGAGVKNTAPELLNRTFPQGNRTDTYLENNKSCSFLGSGGRLLSSSFSPGTFVGFKGKFHATVGSPIIGAVVWKSFVLYATRKYSFLMEDTKDIINFYVKPISKAESRLVYSHTLYTADNGYVLSQYAAKMDCVYFSPDATRAVFRYFSVGQNEFKYYNYAIAWSEDGDPSVSLLSTTQFEPTLSSSNNTSEGFYLTIIPLIERPAIQYVLDNYCSGVTATGNSTITEWYDVSSYEAAEGGIGEVVTMFKLELYTASSNTRDTSGSQDLGMGVTMSSTYHFESSFFSHSITHSAGSPNENWSDGSSGASTSYSVTFTGPNNSVGCTSNYTGAPGGVQIGTREMPHVLAIDNQGTLYLIKTVDDLNGNIFYSGSLPTGGL